MQPVRTVLKLSLAAATLALPFWGAFGFLMIGAAVLCIGSVWLVLAPIWRD